MLFFRKKNNRTRLGELLMESGSLWKAGREKSAKHPCTLDDVYGLTEEFRYEPRPGERVGLPSTGRRNAS